MRHRFFHVPVSHHPPPRVGKKRERASRQAGSLALIIQADSGERPTMAGPTHLETGSRSVTEAGPRPMREYRRYGRPRDRVHAPATIQIGRYVRVTNAVWPQPGGSGTQVKSATCTSLGWDAVPARPTRTRLTQATWGQLRWPFLDPSHRHKRGAGCMAGRPPAALAYVGQLGSGPGKSCPAEPESGLSAGCSPWDTGSVAAAQAT